MISLCQTKCSLLTQFGGYMHQWVTLIDKAICDDSDSTAMNCEHNTGWTEIKIYHKSTVGDGITTLIFFNKRVTINECVYGCIRWLNVR